MAFSISNPGATWSMPPSAAPAPPSAFRIGNGLVNESLVLEAGGLKLDAVLSGGVRIPPSRLRFSVYEATSDAVGERALIVPDVSPNTVVRLNAGIYHVVSTYGTVNAVIRSDIRVEAGKLTEAMVEHKAAEVTMKLVREARWRGDRRHLLVDPLPNRATSCARAWAPSLPWCWQKETTPSSPRTATGSISANSPSRPAANRDVEVIATEAENLSALAGRPASAQWPPSSRSPFSRISGMMMSSSSSRCRPPASPPGVRSRWRRCRLQNAACHGRPKAPG